MSNQVSITSSKIAFSIVVINGAYERFCAGEETRVVVPTESDTCGPIVNTRNLTISLATDPSAEEWIRFRRLVDAWRQQRGATSSITRAALCPAYQEIIGMGTAAVPFILAELESEGDEPDQWFWALKAITLADPVPIADRGDFVAMARSWLDWARREGYAW